jgi:hypothetical protein
MSATLDTRTEELRKEAVQRLQQRSDFWVHFTGYVIFNAALVLVWFMMGGNGFFWPVFPILGWGIGVVFHSLEVFRRPPTEERIRQEMQRLT